MIDITCLESCECRYQVYLYTQRSKSQCGSFYSLPPPTPRLQRSFQAERWRPRRLRLLRAPGTRNFPGSCELHDTNVTMSAEAAGQAVDAAVPSQRRVVHHFITSGSESVSPVQPMRHCGEEFLTPISQS